MRERAGNALELVCGRIWLCWNGGVHVGAETNPYSEEMNGDINLPPAPVGILRQIRLWCCTTPWDAGQGELAKFLPWVTLSAQRSGRVRPVSLSPQAREKVTAVPGWGPTGPHVCTWGQDRDRVLLTCSAGAAPSAPGAVSDAVSPAHTLSLDLFPKTSPWIFPCPFPDSVSLQSCWVWSTWDEGVELCSIS